MKKKTQKTLKFENNYKVIASKSGGFVLIIHEGKCFTIPALKILRQALISLSIKDRDQKIKENEAA